MSAHRKAASWCVWTRWGQKPSRVGWGSAWSSPPQEEPAPQPAGRARQEIDYGRRRSGYVFGAVCPATGDAFTAPYHGRTTANWVNFLEQVDAWLPSEVARI